MALVINVILPRKPLFLSACGIFWDLLIKNNFTGRNARDQFSYCLRYFFSYSGRMISYLLMYKGIVSALLCGMSFYLFIHGTSLKNNNAFRNCIIFYKFSSGISFLVSANPIAFFIISHVMNGWKLSSSNCMNEHWFLLEILLYH